MLDLIRNEVQTPLRYNYDLIAAGQREAVIDAAIDIKQRSERAQTDLIAAGQRLNQVKEMLPHGQFERWIGTEFNMSMRMAQNLMNVARRFDGKSETVSLLNGSVLYMLAAPSTPDEAIEQAANEAQATGKSPTKARVKEIIEEHRTPGETPAQRAERFRSEAAAVRVATGKCKICHRTLTDPEHVADGCGPVCAAKQAAVVEPEPDDLVGNGPLDDDDDEPTPTQSRQARLRSVLEAWRAALATLPDVGELTGYYQHEPVRRAVQPVIEAIGRNLL